MAADRRPRYLLPFELRRPQRWKFSEEDGKRNISAPGRRVEKRGGCPGAARWDGETGGGSPKKRSGTARDGSSNLCPKRLGKDFWESLPALCLSFPPGTAVRGARRSSGRALGQRGWTSGQKSHFSHLHSEVENAAFSGAEAAQAVPLVPQAGFVHLPLGARALALPREREDRKSVV